MSNADQARLFGEFVRHQARILEEATRREALEWAAVYMADNYAFIEDTLSQIDGVDERERAACKMLGLDDE